MNNELTTPAPVFTVEWVQHDGPNSGVLQSKEFAVEADAVHHTSALTSYVNTDVVSHSPWVSAWTLNGRDSSYDYNAEDVKGVVDYAASIEYPLSHSDFRVIDGIVWVENVRIDRWYATIKRALLSVEKAAIYKRAEKSGINLGRDDVKEVAGVLTIDGMPAGEWLDAMTS